MERVYLNEYICKTIKMARMNKGMRGYTLAYLLGKSPASVSRLENSRATYISKEVASKLESILDISICAASNNELVQKVNELMQENIQLKKLLIEKWQSQELEMDGGYDETLLGVSDYSK